MRLILITKPYMIKKANIALLIFAFLISFLSYRCDENGGESYPSEPIILGVSDSFTFVSDTIEIYGKNFGFADDSSYVKLYCATDGAIETVKSYNCEEWLQAKIRFSVPRIIGEIDVSVVVGGLESNLARLNVSEIPDLETVEVQGGQFFMGSETGFDDEKPLRDITITKDLLVLKYEVSQRLWRIVRGENPSSYVGDSLPVHGVSWLEAIEFCNALSDRLGSERSYEIIGDSVIFNNRATGWRLPTEAEWEYLCRAGTDGDYSGTGVLKEMGWFNQNSGYQPHNIGGKGANQFGLFDVHGNVWEWCWDWYDSTYYDKFTVAVDPIGPGEGERRVIRGGSCVSGEAYCRSANRKFPEGDSAFCGFRVVKNR